jgi:hypothetical protein
VLHFPSHQGSDVVPISSSAQKSTLLVSALLIACSWNAGKFAVFAETNSVPPTNAQTLDHRQDLAIVLNSANPEGWNASNLGVYRATVPNEPAPAPPRPGSTQPQQAEISPQAEHAQPDIWFATAQSISGAAIQPFEAAGDPDGKLQLVEQEFHCSAIIRRAFQRGQRRITADVFTFPNSDDAYGAYRLLRSGSSTVVKRGDDSSEDESSLSFWKDKYFVRVFTTSEDDDESKEVMHKLADQLAAAIPANAALPKVIAHLPDIDRVRGSEKLIMGPVSARRFFPAPYIGSLAFANAKGAAVADYQVSYPYPERLKLLFVDYADYVTAQHAYDGYVSALEEGRESERESPSVTADVVLKINGTYLLCGLRGERLVVVSGARKKASPTMLARQLY